jgi:CheY-like chemotaxis protein
MKHTTTCQQDAPIQSHTTLRPTILIVDDDSRMLDLMDLIFTDEGCYIVARVSNGREALLWAVAQQQPPQLLLLDYMLCGSTVNGIELYDLLHMHDGWQEVPAIIVSATVPQDEVQKRHLTSLAKPFDVDTLLSMVDAALLKV